jgi:hypothetical protein
VLEELIIGSGAARLELDLGGERRPWGLRDRESDREGKNGTHIWRGEWRASRNGGWEGEFEGVCKMEACLEALLEMDFCSKPPNFGVEVHMEAPLDML